MVEVHKCSEDKKADAEIVVENAAGQPGSGDEQSDSPCDQHREISPWTPASTRGFRRLTSGIVTRNPEVLRRVHDGQHAGTIAALWDLHSFDKRHSRGQQEPQKLGGE